MPQKEIGSDSEEKKSIELCIEIPSSVDVNIEGSIIGIKGDGGELKRKFYLGDVRVYKKDDKIMLSSKSNRRKEKELLGTIRGHIQNMIRGVTAGITYKMKIVYSHFPMTIKIHGSKMNIDNFLGEKYSRTVDIPLEVAIEIKGQDVLLKGIDKEKVSQTAANIEQITRIKDRDPRVFQDGIYIVEKDGKLLV